MSYAREVKMPRTSHEGFSNFVQLIINQLEAGNTREGLLQAVDLLDCIESSGNPYKDITDAEHSRANALVAEMNRKHSAELVDAIARARADGIAAGIAQERGRLAAMLGIAA